MSAAPCAVPFCAEAQHWGVVAPRLRVYGEAGQARVFAEGSPHSLPAERAGSGMGFIHFLPYYRTYIIS